MAGILVDFLWLVPSDSLHRDARCCIDDHHRPRLCRCFGFERGHRCTDRPSIIASGRRRKVPSSATGTQRHVGLSFLIQTPCLYVHDKSSNNIPNTYSAALSIQALGRPFAIVPRFLWVFVVFVVYTVAGVAGREHFSEILTDFLSVLSYWTTFFIVIVAEEHFIFRRKRGALGGYNLDDWDNPSKYVPSFGSC